LSDIDAETKTPDWMKETKIGQMLDKKTPKNAPSGMGYAMAVGLTKAEESFKEKSEPGFFERKNNEIKEVLKQEDGLPGFLGRVNGRIEKAWGKVLDRTEEYHQGKRGLLVDTILPNAADLYGAAIAPASELIGSTVGKAMDVTGLDDAVQNGFQAFAGSEFGGDVIEKGQQIYDKVEEVAPNQLDTLKSVGKAALDTADLVGAGQLIKAAGKGITAEALVDTGQKALQKTSKTVTKQFEREFDEVVKTGIDKGAKPQFRGALRGDPKAQMQYYRKASNAVRSIIDETPNLKYIDDTGNIVSEGHAPSNLNEFLQAIPQVKKSIFERYSAATAEATGQGARIDLDDLVDNLIEFSQSKVKDIADDSKTKYALDMAEKLMKHKSLNPTETEELIAELNQSLAPSYATKSAKGVSEVDMSVANFLREKLDSTVLGATGEEYQSLKNAYGALKAIEKDVAHQALKVARGNAASFTDMTDIFTNGELLLGVVSGNPGLLLKGLAGKATKAWYKNLNSPDANIMRMFNRAQKSLRQGTIDTSAVPAAAPTFIEQ
jgi:hypothetical protein